MLPPGCVRRLADLLGPRGYLDRPEDLALYEYDGGVDEAPPGPGGFPAHHGRVAEIVRIVREFDVPFVGRGAGTGLSGGAIPREGGVMVAFARMNRILEIDLDNERAVVRAGRGQLGYHPGGRERKDTSTRPIPPASAPAPSAATWPRMPAARTPWPTASPPTTCWASNWCCPMARVVETGGKEPDLPGYDLTGLLTGSEGTMALVTRIIVRLMRKPEACKTMPGHLRIQRGRRPHGGRDHRARHHAGGRGDARRRDAAHGGRSHPRRLSHGCRRRCC